MTDDPRLARAQELFRSAATAARNGDFDGARAGFRAAGEIFAELPDRSGARHGEMTCEIGLAATYFTPDAVDEPNHEQAEAALRRGLARAGIEKPKCTY